MNVEKACVIKFDDNTYYGGYGKGKRKSIVGAQLYSSKKKAETAVSKSTYFNNYTHNDYSIVELLILETEDKQVNNRKIQYYKDKPDHIWEYFVKGEHCSCGANVYHHEYDQKSNTVFCVCNGCKQDIYAIKDEYTKDVLAEGIWK